ncbi:MULTISPECIES: hypothetical protein [Sphingomonas]|uniref:hypothetical protein n=1 Tax=Sphingomonas TaxID=13687 RepID=UPI0013B3EA9C|nr:MULTISPECIES: hypothetical protein [Sphingomonas]
MADALFSQPVPPRASGRMTPRFYAVIVATALLTFAALQAAHDLFFTRAVFA